MYEISEAQSACIIMNTKRCNGRSGYIFSKFLHGYKSTSWMCSSMLGSVSEKSQQGTRQLIAHQEEPSQTGHLSSLLLTSSALDPERSS